MFLSISKENPSWVWVGCTQMAFGFLNPEMPQPDVVREGWEAQAYPHSIPLS